MPWFALAQAPGRVLRVACLASGEGAALAGLIERVEKGLAAAGLPRVQVRGFVSSGVDAASMLRSASEAVAWSPDAILAPGPLHAFAARDATSTIPVIFFAVPDPDVLGLVAELARPGANVTGSGSDAAAVVLKRLELAREILPRARRMAALFRQRPNSPTALIQRIRRDLAASAARLGLEFSEAEVGPDGLGAALAALERRRPEAIVPFGPYAWEPDGRAVDSAAVLREFERRTRTLFVVESVHEVREGLTAAIYAAGSQLAAGVGQLARVLKGARPAELPVQLPLAYSVAVNPGAARAIGLTIPPSVMLRADVVVQ